MVLKSQQQKAETILQHKTHLMNNNQSTIISYVAPTYKFENMFSVQHVSVSDTNMATYIVTINHFNFLKL
jgi:hypothetical protein